MRSVAELKYALPSLGVATLYSYPVWRQVNAAMSPYTSAFRSHGPYPVMIVAAMLHTLAVALLIFAGAALTARRKPGAAGLLDRLFIGVSVLLFLAYLPSIVPDWRFGLPLGVVVFICTLFGLLVPKLQRPFTSAGAAVVCSLALLPAILTASLAGQYVRTTAVQGGSFARKSAGGKAVKRLVWVVLDEFDPGIAITSRPPGLKLPVLDGLLNSSVWGVDVDPAGPGTNEVIPAYMTGRRVNSVMPEAPSQLRIRYATGGESTLSKEKTIFDRLKERGVRSAATGWCYPVCRWLSRDSVEECQWVSAVDVFVSLRRESTGQRYGLGWALKQNFMSAATFGIWETAEEHRIAREQHLEAFNGLHEAGLRQLSDPSLGFLFLHYNVPHPLGIYDSRRGTVTISEHSTYLDNLALADRVLADLLEAARRQGDAGHTAFLITSDHGFRPEVWNTRKTWAQEAPEVKAHPKDTRVLFLFHDPSDRSQVVVKEKLNAVSGHDLALAWLEGKVQGHAAVAAWLKQDKSGER